MTNMADSKLWSIDNFLYHGTVYERDIHTNRYYLYERSRDRRHNMAALPVKRRISSMVFSEAYKNCRLETYDYIEEDENMTAVDFVIRENTLNGERKI